MLDYVMISPLPEQLAFFQWDYPGGIVRDFKSRWAWITRRLLPDEHYRIFTERDLSGLRNSRGIVIGTARANPGKGIDKPADLDDPQKTAHLRNVYNAMVDLEIEDVEEK